MKDQSKMKFCSLALAGLFLVSKASSASLDDIRIWAGSGTNHAALVVGWSAPETFGGSTVPAPTADRTFVWGYRFNGTATGSQMLAAILAADPRLYVVADMTYGTYVVAFGYNFTGAGGTGIADGGGTNFFSSGFLTNATVNVDAAAPLNPGDLYWGGYYGPNWEVWNELHAAGGLLHSPERGPDPYWTPDDPGMPYFGGHGQWELAQMGLDGLLLTNGSWVGFSVAAGKYESDPDAPYNSHKHAPGSPDVSFTGIVPPAIQNFTGVLTNRLWQGQCLSRTNWSYSLERSADLRTWIDVASGIPGNGASLTLTDSLPPAAQSFYRVRADLP